MDTITITVAENDPDVIVSATLNEDAVTITLNEAATGAGVPAGGSTNDILKKTSSTNYDTEWETPTAGATPDTIVRRDETGGAFFGGDVGASKYRGNNYQAESSTDGASLRNSAGTAILTWGATAGNISITVDTNSTGHFLSAPSTATAGHFVTKNGTTPTIAAGRSAWFSSSTGDPQFRNGTSSAVTLVRSTDLGTNVATFLATPNSANLIAAVTDETGSGLLVFNNSPTIHDLDIQESVNFNVSSYNYTTESAALHRTALGLTTLATTTPGANVATALGVNVGSAGAFVTFNGALGTPSSGTVTNLTGTASININGTVGATTRNTGDFTTITATGAAAVPITCTTSGQESARFVANNQYSGFRVCTVNTTNGTPYVSLCTGATANASSFGTQKAFLAYWGDTAAYASVGYGGSSHSVLWNTTSGGVTIGGSTTDAGATNLLVVGKVTASAGLVLGTFTVATFPATTYLEAVVTDSLAPVVGATVAAGGSAKCKVMYNGSAKIVTAVL